MWITSLNSHFPHQETQHQILGRKKAEPKTPHFLSLHQNIVAGSQEEKCELSYSRGRFIKLTIICTLLCPFEFRLSVQNNHLLIPPNA
jgi:hypothetical protein